MTDPTRWPMKIEVASRYSASLLLSVEAGSLKLALEASVKSRDADLRDADLRGANLRGANLRGANLRGANLRDADLRGADLSGADLRDADLSDADLRDADLSGADLRGADLRDADLSGADLRGADLRGARGVIDGGYPDQWHAAAWWRKGILVVSIGCRTKTLAEARRYWQGKDNRREVMAFLDYAEAVAKIRGVK